MTLCKFMPALLALLLAATGIEAQDSASYIYSVWHPAVVYARGGSTTTLEVFTAAGVKSVTLLFGSGSSADRWPLYDDGTHGDKRAGDLVFTSNGITYDIGPSGTLGISDYVANLEIVLSSGATETASPALLGIIEQKPEQHWSPTLARTNVWVTDYGVFIKDDGKIFPGFPNCGTTIGRGNTEPFRRLYEIFPDEFDFVTVMPSKDLHDPAKKCNPSPYSTRVKNQVEHIGLDLLDLHEEFHSQGRLKMTIFHSFGIPQILDHEMGHAWGANLGKSLGLSDEETQEKFGYFLEALASGAPPHGGIAFGFDRLVMILAGEESIREVIPFPKTTSATDLMTGSPSGVDERQLAELGLKLR